MEQRESKPLSTVKAGETVKLAEMDVGKGLKGRLTSMGLLPNVNVDVVSDGSRGPFVISVKDSKMMLGRGVANKIMVWAE